MVSRRAFLAGAALSFTSCSRDTSRLAKAAEYLWSQQADDGGWHSKTYGLMRSGQSLTPFVLDALLDVPAAITKTVMAAPEAAVERAVAFIKRNLKDGLLGLNGDSLDYPNYATGLAVRALCRAKVGDRQAPVNDMLRALRAQQFTELNGWHRDDAPYGAWGMGGQVRTPPDAGHVDLAMTRYVLEGFAAAGVKPPDEALTKALVFIEHCQNPDGGFYFSTVEADINKAGGGADGGKFRSYGSTTADGILALRACGVAKDDSRMKRAMDWLRTHHKVDRVPGFEATAREVWSHGLRYYYMAAVSSAMPELNTPLLPARADGSWSNPVNIVKEDDPLIATPFALRVLCNHKGE
jgi:squalene-hopene/tetraprenyl-beta-curcumene cyclase